MTVKMMIANEDDNLHVVFCKHQRKASILLPLGPFPLFAQPVVLYVLGTTVTKKIKLDYWFTFC